ncbi:MAG: carboxypeptidase regulatory-like domain-containing protein [Labilithrix sp.]|nr:carboxypeptidase regulatory-like domain-containing protein [Labilithrix sp.]
MKRELLRISPASGIFASVAAFTFLFAASAPAQDAGKAGPLDAGAVMPAGHPAVPDEADDPHANPHGNANPHGGAASGHGAAEEQIPEDGAMEDPSIPKGTVQAHIADPSGRPLARTEVTLGMIFNSVAKGESRKRISAMTDDVGVARFSELEVGSGVAYRVMVLKDGATFSVTPFQLGQRSGMRTLLHVYPVVDDIEQALVVSQSILYTEVKDDRIQIQQAFKIYNFGRVAWVPSDMVVALPPEFTAFATQQGMTDVGVEAIPKKGVKLRGTFGPGQHVVEFRWQLPYSGDAEVKIDVGMLPHLAAARIIAPAAKGMTLEVDGFAPPQPSTDGTGQRALITERQMRREEAPVKELKIAIRGLPTEGPGKVLATFLAFAGVLTGVFLGSRKPPPRDTKSERQQLFVALEALELAFREKSVGPKTYERARREIIDDIARTFASEHKTRKGDGPKAAKARSPKTSS